MPMVCVVQSRCINPQCVWVNPGNSMSAICFLYMKSRNDMFAGLQCKQAELTLGCCTLADL